MKTVEHRSCRDPVDTDLLVAMYVEEGLSTYEIGRRVGLNHQRVTRLLRQTGISIAAKGRGRAKPIDRQIAEQLRHLYCERQLDSEQIGRMLGLSGRTVRERLAKLGIERRPRGGLRRHDRHAIDREKLERLYVDQVMSADAIAEKLGASRWEVLQSAHDQNLPVRPGGNPSKGGDLDVRTLECLYGDVMIRRTLKRFAIPIVKEPGAIWERFPRPIPVSREIVTALYQDCGLSVRHIELLTGNPQVTIARRMREWHIKLRPPGGPSPFLKQWRKRQRSNRKSR